MTGIETKSINAIRILSADAIQKANSGHPGLPLGAAPMAYELWAKHMRHNPADPKWENRDRFILSGGHGSMLLYSLLHLFGYGLTVDDILGKISEVREQVGDRGVLRALHFIRENERVQREVAALKKENINEFLKHVAASGNSSYKYLQNVYSNSDVQHQNVSLALAISEDFLGGNGVCRVHGGGFAGTIQAVVKNEVVTEYQKRMNTVFGSDACSVLKIRKYGGMKVM